MHDHIATPFDELPPVAAEHFRLYTYAAVHHVLHQLGVSLGGVDELVQHFPFLQGYLDELAAHSLEVSTRTRPVDWWCVTLDHWESRTHAHLPLRDLRHAAGVDHTAVMLLLSAGLLEEDARFGTLFEAMQGSPGQHRPTLGLLAAWWRAAVPGDPRSMLRRWQELGLIEILNPDSPRLEWAMHVPAPLWDAFRGDPQERPAVSLRYSPPGQLVALEDVIIDAELRASSTRLPDMLRTGLARAVVARGPQHNGRRTLLGALARAIGRGVLEVERVPSPAEWRCIGPLATLLNAMPVVRLDLAPGEAVQLEPLTAYAGPLAVVTGNQGGLYGPDLESAVVLDVRMPDSEVRRQHWLRCLDGCSGAALQTISDSFRLTGGHIRRAAALARVEAHLAGRPSVSPADVQRACRALNRQVLDTLTVRLDTVGDWSHLAVGEQTWRELRNLESRCRQREHLQRAAGKALDRQLNAGVRAMFVGPSGTGKSLAARLLARALGRDLYRLDLASVVNKYIGETEKNLDRAFSRAEELDVILLIDEGDALLTSRTAVQSSNDRYANLETNFLLQRLESFEGIVLITTNASQHIDVAFQRRMDVVIAFPPPGALERWQIWNVHLPAGHAVDIQLLEDIARRCELRGGQIRNAVLHASLLALDDGGTLTSAHLVTAVRREYRKINAVCPLKDVLGEAVHA
jgi:hypothetical protein